MRVLTIFLRLSPKFPSAMLRRGEYYVNVLGFHFDWGNDAGGPFSTDKLAARAYL
jgi:hypothetical protein